MAGLQQSGLRGSGGWSRHNTTLLAWISYLLNFEIVLKLQQMHFCV